MAKKKSKKMGRPKIEIDFEQLDRMCEFHCTQEEIAAILGVSIDTIEARIKEKHGVSFPEYFAQKSASGKMSLRRRQYTTAMKGNTTMLIWLGKNWLDQKDKEEQQVNITNFEFVGDD